MIHIWQKIIDAIFPPSTSLIVLRQFKNIPYDGYYEKKTINSVTVLSSYQSPLIKASITAGKFEHNQTALANLGKILRLHLNKETSSLPEHSTVFVPIPLHPKRELKRGYNQVETVLKAALQNTSYRITPLLKRTVNTSPQSHLNRTERLKHLQNVFAYRRLTIDWETITTVVLIDDVLTTGSTLEAAHETLIPHLPSHVQLHMIALAH